MRTLRIEGPLWDVAWHDSLLVGASSQVRTRFSPLYHLLSRGQDANYLCVHQGKIIVVSLGKSGQENTSKTPAQQELLVCSVRVALSRIRLLVVVVEYNLPKTLGILRHASSNLVITSSCDSYPWGVRGWAMRLPECDGWRCTPAAPHTRLLC